MHDKKPLKILNSDRIDGDALIVDFADDTSAIFTSEQLIALAPQRLKTEFELPSEWGGEWSDIYLQKPR
jgi:hypothetical protein